MSEFSAEQAKSTGDEYFNQPNHQENLNEPENEEGPFANFKNVVPIEKLKNGWFTISSLVMQGSARVHEKIIETYNSEQVQNIKQKTVETVGPAWEKTCEAAGPVWEQAKQGAVVVAENIKPALESATELAVHNATAAYITIADTIKKSFTESSESANPSDSTDSGGGGPSVLDQATKGGPMTV